MIRMTERVRWAMAALLLLVFTEHMLWASPSGLNNIPTTDVVPEKTLVLQTWLNMADSMQTQQFVGFKAGAFKGLEFGVDWKAYGETHGHAAGQAKYAFNIMGETWRGVVGVANLTENRRHDGYFFPYVATSVDLKMARLHFGYAPQPHNEAFFAGIDRTFPFLERNLQLKGDAIHINDKNDVLFSVGFLYELGRRQDSEAPKPTGLLGTLDTIVKNIVMEAWISLPSTGEEETWTLKFNYVIKF